MGPETDLLTAPAKADGAIEYKKSRLTIDLDANVYTGPPRPVHDEAWSHLPERM